MNGQRWAVERVSEASTGFRGISIKVAGENRYIANMVGQLDDSEKFLARLIAASPELLEALRHQVQRNHEFNPNCDGCAQAQTLLAKFKEAA